MDEIMKFLKRPVITLDGFRLTVAALLVIALIWIVWRRR